jgi:HEAT repeat protein
LGRLRITHIDDQPIVATLLQRLSDRDPKVAITAAWLLTINNAELGQKNFDPWLSHQDRDIRLLAASALASTGKYGVPLMRKAFQTTQDPYVRMNLAMGLITQRVDINKACDALYNGLMELHERWMWEEQSGFKVFAPSKVKYDDVIPNNPETVNQLTRLEVLNTLAIMKYPQVQEAVRQFLKEKIWGVTGMASAMLLTEGDESALDIVQQLLQDPDKKVRTQAALILAMWGRGEEAISVLKEAYKDADREMKERILESLGRVGSASTISFLTEKLQEPYQSLRIIAAAALLDCLYN